MAITYQVDITFKKFLKGKAQIVQIHSKPKWGEFLFELNHYVYIAILPEFFGLRRTKHPSIAHIEFLE